MPAQGTCRGPSLSYLSYVSSQHQFTGAKKSKPPTVSPTVFSTGSRRPRSTLTSTGLDGVGSGFEAGGVLLLGGVAALELGGGGVSLDGGVLGLLLSAGVDGVVGCCVSEVGCCVGCWVCGC